MRGWAITLVLATLAALVASAALAATGIEVAELPTGPGWAAGDSCRSVAEAAALRRNARENSAESIGVALRSIPRHLRDAVALCRWMNNWFVAPAGWHEQRAARGADGGSTWVFVAPGGEAHGWFVISVAPACASCMLGGAEGYFPEAQQLAATLYPSMPVATLSPKPDSLTHPDRCTAIVTYRAAALQVQGQLYFDPPVKGAISDRYGDVGLTTAFAALPAREAKLQALMLKSFWGGRPPETRPCPTGEWTAE